MKKQYDCVVIGAGPAGALTAHYIKKYQPNASVLIIEKELFPRFILGESLLPLTMEHFEELDLLRPIVEAGHQYKNGAYFVRGDQQMGIDFRLKKSKGWSTTYQVKRDGFDLMLCNEAQKKGIDILFEQQITRVEQTSSGHIVHLSHRHTHETQSIAADYIFDASSFNSVMVEHYGLARPSNFPVRTSYFAHITDHTCCDTNYDRNKILVSVHDDNKEVWAWLIPFSDGTSSLGFVLPEGYDVQGDDDEAIFQQLLKGHSHLRQLLKNHQMKTPVQRLQGYSRKTSSMHGTGFTLVGNAGAFLDPVFSSGIAIACVSAKLAVQTYVKQQAEPQYNAALWEESYVQPLLAGINVFEKFVRAWYDGRLQEIIFRQAQTTDKEITQHVISILAGYAWDKENVFAKDADRVLNMIGEYLK